MLRAFCKDESGTFAPICCIASVPLLAAVAMAVDYSFISTKASELQSSLDATALAIGTEYYSGMTTEELQQLGEHYFGSNLYGYEPPSELDLELDNSVSALEVNATASGDDNFIKVRSKIDHEGMIASRSSTLKSGRLLGLRSTATTILS
jgi:hypothetical protein